MKNKINKTIALLALMLTININAAPVGTGFNYQGELLLNGEPVNTPKVFTFSLYDAATDGNKVGFTITKGSEYITISDLGLPVLIPESGIPVNNGLFNVSNLDFGPQYTGEELWLKITVKSLDPDNCGVDCPIPVTLSPRQKIKAVPYAVQADYLGPIGASNGDVLKFDGNDWVPSAIAPGNSPWVINSSNINFTAGQVTIGSTANNADLLIDATNDGDVLRARVNTSTKLVLKDNGGLAVGRNTTAPDNGLLVQGSTILESIASVSNSNGGLSIGDINANHLTMDSNDIQVRNGSTNDAATMYLNFYGGDVHIGNSSNDVRMNGNTKQITSLNGMMKYMVFATCAGLNPSIPRSYNGVSNSAISITSGSGDIQCVITFPSNIDSRYWQVSPVNASKDRGAHCVEGAAANQLNCYRYTTSTGVNNGGDIMILVY